MLATRRHIAGQEHLPYEVALIHGTTSNWNSVQYWTLVNQSTDDDGTRHYEVHEKPSHITGIGTLTCNWCCLSTSTSIYAFFAKHYASVAMKDVNILADATKYGLRILAVNESSVQQWQPRSLTMYFAVQGGLVPLLKDMNSGWFLQPDFTVVIPRYVEQVQSIVNDCNIRNLLLCGADGSLYELPKDLRNIIASYYTDIAA